MMLSTILATVVVAVSTIGFFLARWIINTYKRAANYGEDTAIVKEMQSSHALSENNDDINETTDKLKLIDAKSSKSKLNTKLPVYSGPNPFKLVSLSSYEKFKIYLFCMTGIAPLKLFLFFLFVILLYFISLPVSMWNPSPNSFISKFTIRFMRYWIGCSLLLFGFYYIDITDSSKRDDKEPFRVIAANHQTIFDGLVLLWRTNGVIAAKKEISKTPFIGRIMTLCGTLWIDRAGKKGRNNAKQQIIDQVNDITKPPLIIFPQGTTSNVRTVTQFKTGAYLAGKKVLNVALNWSKNLNCDLSFVGDVNGLVHVLHVGCCQFINYCNIDIVNEHIPSENEKKDINLFALNSRKYIISSLNKFNFNKNIKIQGTKHSYSDFILLKKAYSRNRNFNTSHILMDDIISSLRLRTKTVTYLAGIFAQLDLNDSGFIEYNEFCIAFGRDPIEFQNSLQMRNLFELYNTRNCEYEKIGFNEFLVGVATCFMDDKIKDAIKIVFNACIYEQNDDNNNNNDSNKYILGDNIIDVYCRNVDKNKFNNSIKYDNWIQKIEIFTAQIFNKKNKLSFNEFYNAVIEYKYEYIIQHFLQSIILLKLKIKLDKNDFVIKKNEMDKLIYINPLSQLVRSTSIQSVHQL